MTKRAVVHPRTLVLTIAGLSTAVVVALMAMLPNQERVQSGTSTDLQGTWSTLTLAEAKPPAQLIRNESVSGIPASVIASIGPQTDTSIACLDTQKDPDGTIRRWKSTVEVFLTPQAADRVNDIVSDLVADFSARGWTAQSLSGDGGHSTLLTLATSESLTVRHSGIYLLIVPVEGPNASVQIDSESQCVVTGGEDSDEVQSPAAVGELRGARPL